MRIASAVLLVSAAVAVGCGETDDPEGPFNQTPGTIATTTGGGAANPGATPGGVTAGGLTGSVTPGTVGGGTTGGGSVLPPAAGGGGATTGGGGGTTGGGTTGGGSASSDWCKVKKILDTKCVACHTTPLAAGAPFPLAKYDDLIAAHPTKAGKKVYERVGVRVHADKSKAEGLTSMPPGTELPADQLALIDAWVAAKAPAGADPTCAGNGPAVDPSTEVWPLPECDVVYKIVSHAPSGTGPYMVPPGQEIHPQVSVAAPWGSEKVQAIAFKAITDNKAVLHHWILNGGGAFLNGWAPGEDGIKKMGPDTGMDMPSGTLRLDMHYNSLQLKGAAQPDASGLEICAVKAPNFRKNHVAVTMGLSNFLFSIPAGAKNQEVKASCTVSSPVTILTASPHSHTFAVRHRFTVKKKNGMEIVMHDKPFQFGEQKTYPLDAPLSLEAGDVINTSCFFTNTSNRAVTFGENTGNEMCFNFASYYPAGKLTCGAGGLDIGSIFGGGGP